MVSFSSLAQTQQPSAACTTTQECTAQQKSCQTPKTHCKAKSPKADPFAGLTLSESQKTQLNALKAKRAEARAEKCRPDRQTCVSTTRPVLPTAGSISRK